LASPCPTSYPIYWGLFHILGLIPEWISDPLRLVLGSALHPNLRYMASYEGVHSVGLAARGTPQVLVSARFLLVGVLARLLTVQPTQKPLLTLHSDLPNLVAIQRLRCDIMHHNILLI
jgi:hypothetical protein